jgi:hypothetical protein
MSIPGHENRITGEMSGNWFYNFENYDEMK